MAGFSEPILHGLCTYGYATRHIQNKFPEETIFGVKGRFSSPVLPGQTLITKMWREGDKCLYEVWIKETNKKALSGGFVEFKTEGHSDATNAADSSALASDASFALMASRVSAEYVAQVKGIFKFDIKQDGKGKNGLNIEFRRISQIENSNFVLNGFKLSRRGSLI